MSKEIVEGRDVVIEFDGRRCIHSRGCVLSHPEVFVPNVEGEWIHPDAAGAEQVALVAYNCPSGAIQVRRRDGKPDEAPPLVNTVRVLENGPLAFRAPLALKGEDLGLRRTLCRCGQSQDKPYCDASHAKAGFVATGEPAAVASEALAPRDGPVTLDPRPNGPLHVTGPLEVVSGTGHTVNRVTEAWFCRCGHSANKPYCDGTHKKIGFVAP